MRTNIRTIIGITLVSALVLTASCKGKTEESKETPTEATMEHEGHDMGEEGHDMDHKDMDAKQGKEYTSTYVCPMHCEGSGSETEGKCPVCGMTYVLNEDKPEGEQSHN
ncbi:heavy metal-binding domain-containing protein [Flagellimonas baculiformis]|uniref:heavy metal-binding domain-containing protein n=1 Tax=Flagellimonas baculiformis TaxID=3067310 RepID=UPI00296FC124|nr:heavy metal-binding domain-containing protein [Muricauda sp. D6]